MNSRRSRPGQMNHDFYADVGQNPRTRSVNVLLRMCENNPDYAAFVFTKPSGFTLSSADVQAIRNEPDPVRKRRLFDSRLRTNDRLSINTNLTTSMKNWCNRNGMPVFGGLIGPGYTQNPTGNESAQFLYRKMSAVQRDEPLMLTHLANLPRGTARTVTSRWVRGSITSRMDQIDQSIAELYTLI